MYNHIKSVLSVCSIGIFILLAIASQEVDSKFEPSYTKEDCIVYETKVVFEPDIMVNVIDKITEQPISGAQVYIFVHKYIGKALDGDPPCKRIPFTTEQAYLISDETGSALAFFNPVTFKNEIDKLMITIEVVQDGYEFNQLVVARNYYSTSKVNATIPLIPIEQLDAEST
jgi:hypothetical protein